MKDKVLKRSDPRLECYQDVLRMAGPKAVVVEDARGVLRFRASPMVRELCDSGLVDLNRMAVVYQRGLIARSTRVEFYVGLGYSLAGFGEVFAEELSLEAQTDRAEKGE